MWWYAVHNPSPSTAFSSRRYSSFNTSLPLGEQRALNGAEPSTSASQQQAILGELRVLAADSQGVALFCYLSVSFCSLILKICQERTNTARPPTSRCLDLICDTDYSRTKAANDDNNCRTLVVFSCRRIATKDVLWPRFGWFSVRFVDESTDLRSIKALSPRSRFDWSCWIRYCIYRMERCLSCITV